MLTGRVVEQGPVDQITRAPQHDYTRRLWEAIPRLPAAAGVEAEAVREGMPS
jgi:peptide/nickel transport system ATP-binding protein